jgi:ABC-type multidrug transport system fused ATPase/permease subunit
LSTIKEMDRIIVMKDGAIVEQWGHETLLNMREWLYSKLWKIQAE